MKNGRWETYIFQMVVDSQGICITKITQEPASVKTMIYKDHDPFDEKGRG